MNASDILALFIFFSAVILLSLQAAREFFAERSGRTYLPQCALVATLVAAILIAILYLPREPRSSETPQHADSTGAILHEHDGRIAVLEKRSKQAPEPAGVDLAPVVRSIEDLRHAIRSPPESAAQRQVSDASFGELLAEVLGLRLALLGVLIIAAYWLLRERTGFLKRCANVSIVLGLLSLAVGILSEVFSMVSGVYDRYNTEDERQLSRVFTYLPASDPRIADTRVYVLTNGVSIVAKAGDSPIAFVVPFEKEASCQVRADGEWVGTSLRPEMRDYLGKLGSDLAACKDASGPARVRVRGFASSSPMKGYKACDDASDPKDANRRIANRRGEVVRDALMKRLTGADADNLKVEALPWRSHAAMETARQYNDRLLDGSYSGRRGALTRRAEVELVEAPGCVPGGNDLTP